MAIHDYATMGWFKVVHGRIDREEREGGEKIHFPEIGPTVNVRQLQTLSNEEGRKEGAGSVHTMNKSGKQQISYTQH